MVNSLIVRCQLLQGWLVFHSHDQAINRRRSDQGEQHRNTKRANNSDGQGSQHICAMADAPSQGQHCQYCIAYGLNNKALSLLVQELDKRPNDSGTEALITGLHTQMQNLDAIKDNK